MLGLSSNFSVQFLVNVTCNSTKTSANSSDCVVHYLEDELCCKRGKCICVFLHPLGLSSTILTWCCLDKLCKLRWDYTAPNLSNINIQQMDGIHFSYINHRAKKARKKTGNDSIFSFSLTTSTFTHGSHPMESTLYRTENIIARSFIFSSSAEFSALFAFIVVSCLWGKF